VGRWSSALEVFTGLTFTVILGSRASNPPDGSLLLPVMKLRKVDLSLSSSSVRYLMKFLYCYEF
jgi:hypothetical protein